MGIRSTLAALVTAPAAAVLDDVVRQLLDEVVDVRPVVRRAEVDAVAARLATVQRELARRDAELDAVRQAVDALHTDLPDELDAELADLLGSDADTVAAAEARQSELLARLDRLRGGAAALRTRLAGWTSQHPAPR